MNIINEVKEFKRRQLLEITDDVIFKMKWYLSNTIITRETVFNVVQKENLNVNFNRVVNVKELSMDDFYTNILLYKDKNKKLFRFVFSKIFS